MLDLEHIRREYLLGGLNREDLAADPFSQFSLWIEQAISSQIPDPTAMVLATVSEKAVPSQRIVLLKHFNNSGLFFYTNYGSKKAHDIEHNPNVSVHFPWHMMERQVRVIGRATKISTAESLKYFISRPRDSQIAAWASKQSRVLESKKFLLAQFEAVKRKFAEGEVPLPDFWGGYRIEPVSFEFWQGGGSRLHDRFEYSRINDGWRLERLAP